MSLRLRQIFCETPSNGCELPRRRAECTFRHSSASLGHCDITRQDKGPPILEDLLKLFVRRLLEIL